MVKLTDDQINKLYDFIGEIPPEEITEHNITEVLIKIEKKLTPYYVEGSQSGDIKNNKNILLVDDLEVSLFQLSRLIARSGYTSFIARTYEEAIDLYKKHNFYHIFLDLFFPEAEDGFKLLKELRGFDKTKENDVKIVVISGTEDKNLINKCFEEGAFDFVPKTQDWHVKVMDTLRKLDEIKRGPVPEIKTAIEDREKGIVSIKIKNIFKSGVMDDLKREAMNLSASGFNNFILDLENVTSNNPEVLNLIVSIFKTCRQNNGALKLCNVYNELGKSLSFVFLDGVIPVFTDKDSALDDFYKVRSET